MFEKRKALSEINLFDCVPDTCFTWTENDKQLVVINMPRFHVPWMQKYLVPKSKSPHIKITLDEFGSLAWKKIDGETTIRRIAEVLVEEFGETVQPIEDRIAKFFQLLKNRGFLRLIGPDGEPLK